MWKIWRRKRKTRELLALLVFVSACYVLWDPVSHMTESLKAAMAAKSSIRRPTALYNVSAKTLSPTEKKNAEKFPWKPNKLETLDCSKLFTGNKQELAKAKVTNITRTRMSLGQMLKETRDCSAFRTLHGFISSPLTEVEKNFPLAFSLLVYKDVLQVLELLRTIYRPQNYYCLHVDTWAKPHALKGFKAIAHCLDNVFLTKRRFRMKWGSFNIVHAEVTCMTELMNRTDWRYFINLTGQEFPLKTNYEIVRILSALRGANDVLAENPRTKAVRWKNYLPAPFGATVHKGSTHVSLSRHFVHYLLTSPEGKGILQWIKPTNIPDEIFFTTLNHNTKFNAPGSYNGPHIWGNLTHKPHVSRFKNWSWDPFRCAARNYTRWICIFSEGDLPLLHNRFELFANKFHDGYSSVATACLAEELYNRTRQQTLGAPSFNVSFYDNLPFLKHIVNGSDFKRFNSFYYVLCILLILSC